MSWNQTTANMLSRMHGINTLLHAYYRPEDKTWRNKADGSIIATELELYYYSRTDIDRELRATGGQNHE